MYHNAFRAWLVIVSGIVLVAAPAFAAEKKKTAAKPDSAAVTVEKVLRAEVAGAVDRRGQLADALKQQPDSPAVRWPAGFVRYGDSWRSFDELSSTTAQRELLKRYQIRRDEAPQTLPGQLDLANWCRKQGLKDQERAHLLLALSLTPDEEQPVLRQRLGYREIGKQWLSPEQLREWQSAIQLAEDSLRKWSAKFERVAARLAGNRAQREAAHADLRAIKDPSAVPAIELVLVGRDEECARAAINVLQHIEGPDSTLALAKQGVFSKWDEIRKTASAALKGRRLEEFVPPLISLLVTPAQGEFRFFHDASRGVFFYSYLMAIEKEDQFQVATLRIAHQLVDSRTGGAVSMSNHGIPIGVDVDAETIVRADADALRSLGDRVQSRKREEEALNDRIQELNGRVIGVLADVSGCSPTPDARQWWGWWAAQSDSQPGAAKPVTVVVDESESALTPVALVPRVDCLAAGTPVWTETGAQAIETIKVGDRLLAKDVETGELAYKPVVQTTVRPPKELTTLRFGDETIVCTGGHRFWSSGSGWIKARDLEPQTLLHTVTGNTPVWSAKKGNTAETYNLVVADFHTYFVGKTGVLCQDLLIPKGTNSVVPGLSRAHATAQK